MQAASARFCSSSASSKKVFSDISHAVARSSYRPLCGKAHEASLSSKDPPKVQKRVSKQERRARVEEFVENYRSSHEGKFPSATSVRQQVGGSYYILWALLQELEYNSRLKNDVRDTSFNSWNCEGKYRFNNIDLSTKDVRTEEETDLPEVQNRVTKQERRTRVEEFVENYRASHDGKFPRATHVRQQVGGSYYIARALLQELEYNSRRKSDVINASFNSENVKGKYGLDNTDHSTRDTITSFEGINEEMTKTSEPLDLNIKPELSDGKIGAAKLNLSSNIYLEDKSEPTASDHIESNKPIKAENLRSPKRTHEGSTGRNLWGSLKSFAAVLGIFWTNLLYDVLHDSDHMIASEGQKKGTISDRFPTTYCPRDKLLDLSRHLAPWKHGAELFGDALGCKYSLDIAVQPARLLEEGRKSASDGGMKRRLERPSTDHGLA